MQKQDTPINPKKIQEFENYLRLSKSSSSDSMLIIIGVVASVPIILTIIIALLLVEGMTY